ncbi:Uncharacterised protein [Actinomadura madurae]|nr:Uncharacterised protein [Actinomadura madurae]
MVHTLFASLRIGARLEIQVRVAWSRHRSRRGRPFDGARWPMEWRRIDRRWPCRGLAARVRDTPPCWWRPAGRSKAGESSDHGGRGGLGARAVFEGMRRTDLAGPAKAARSTSVLAGRRMPAESVPAERFWLVKDGTMALDMRAADGKRSSSISTGPDRWWAGHGRSAPAPVAVQSGREHSGPRDRVRPPARADLERSRPVAGLRVNAPFRRAGRATPGGAPEPAGRGISRGRRPPESRLPCGQARQAASLVACFHPELTGVRFGFPLCRTRVRGCR